MGLVDLALFSCNLCQPREANSSMAEFLGFAESNKAAFNSLSRMLALKVHCTRPPRWWRMTLKWSWDKNGMTMSDHLAVANVARNTAAKRRTNLFSRATGSQASWSTCRNPEYVLWRPQCQHANQRHFAWHVFYQNWNTLHTAVPSQIDMWHVQSWTNSHLLTECLALKALAGKSSPDTKRTKRWDSWNHSQNKFQDVSGLWLYKEFVPLIHHAVVTV